MSGSDEVARGAIVGSLNSARAVNRESLRASLDPWLREQGFGAIEALEDPRSSGASSELFLVTLRQGHDRPNQEFVLRLIGATSAYPYVDPVQQIATQTLISARSAAPAPQIIASAVADSPIGVPFVLMERKYGRAAPDLPSYVTQGWLHDLAPEQQSAVWLAGIEAIAAVHATDLTGVDTAPLMLRGKGDPLDRMLGYWQLYHGTVSEHHRFPVLDMALDVLMSRRPPYVGAPVMVWGDSSLRNMFFDGLSVSAVLDFEFAHLGVPELDVAFYTTMDLMMAHAFADAPRLPGFWSADRTFDAYEQITGRSLVARRYFLLMAFTYTALATTRVFLRLHREGAMPISGVSESAVLRYLERVIHDLV